MLNVFFVLSTCLLSYCLFFQHYINEPMQFSNPIWKMCHNKKKRKAKTMHFTNPIWKIHFSNPIRKMRTPTNAYSGGFTKFSHENLNPIPKNKRSNPNGIRRAYTKFEPESEHKCGRIHRAYTNPTSNRNQSPNTEKWLSQLFSNENIIRNPNSDPNSNPNPNPDRVRTQTLSKSDLKSMWSNRLPTNNDS